MLDTPFKVGISADEVGLGKTLTVLTAALRVEQEKRLNGPILVVCPKQCVEQWFEETVRHFQKVLTPAPDTTRNFIH